VPEFYDGPERDLREVQHVWKYEWVLLITLLTPEVRGYLSRG